MIKITTTEIKRCSMGHILDEDGDCMKCEDLRLDVFLDSKYERNQEDEHEE